MEVSALKHTGVAGIHGALAVAPPAVRRAPDSAHPARQPAAFEALVGRYQSRLLAFCRHMLGSKEDAEDVLQEVFAAAFNAILADERAINVRPWLYRIARNRSLNHLRRTQADRRGLDGRPAVRGRARRRPTRSTSARTSACSSSTSRIFPRRSAPRCCCARSTRSPTTRSPRRWRRPCRASSRCSSARACRSPRPPRPGSCPATRSGCELGEVAEGLQAHDPAGPPPRARCDRCAAFRKQLRETNKALAAVFPVGAAAADQEASPRPVRRPAAGAAPARRAPPPAAPRRRAAPPRAARGWARVAGISAVASKAAAGLAAAAIVGVGAVEVRHAADHAAPVPVVAQQGQAAIRDNGANRRPACRAEGARRRDEAQARAEGQGRAQAGDPRGHDDTRAGRHRLPRPRPRHRLRRRRRSPTPRSCRRSRHLRRSPHPRPRRPNRRRPTGDGGTPAQEEPAARSAPGPGRRTAADPAAGRASARSGPSGRPVAQAAVRLPPMIDWADFEKVDMRVGRVVRVGGLPGSAQPRVEARDRLRAGDRGQAVLGPDQALSARGARRTGSSSPSSTSRPSRSARCAPRSS